jgi:hypothetical protein
MVHPARLVLISVLAIAAMVMWFICYNRLWDMPVIDGGYLQSQLGRAASLVDYARIVWLACSMGIVAGALGSSFDSEEAVRRAAFSRRERQRQARHRQQSDAQEDETGS